MDLSSTSRHKWQLCKTSTADLQPVWTVLVPWFMLGHTVLVWCRGELNRRGSAHYSKSEIIKVISNFGNMTFMTKTYSAGFHVSCENNVHQFHPEVYPPLNSVSWLTLLPLGKLAGTSLSWHNTEINSKRSSGSNHTLWVWVIHSCTLAGKNILFLEKWILNHCISGPLETLTLKGSSVREWNGRSGYNPEL